MHIVAPRDYTLVDLASAVAIAAHTAVGQKRKYTGEDYHRHPIEVLEILKTHYEPSLDEQCAALLHDVVEDTNMTLDHIGLLFGGEVRYLVDSLTDISKPTDGNRATRKAIDRKHLVQSSESAMVIKCADLISNTQSITNHDLEFAKVYLEEKLLLLQAMKTKLEHYRIWARALEVATLGLAKLYPSQKCYDMLIHYGLISKSVPFEQFDKLLLKET